MLEKLVEKTVVDYAESRGWASYKWASPGVKGVHDRIFFKRGVAFTIEFKAPGKKASKSQRLCAETLQKAGILSVCINEIYKGKEFIDTITPLVDARGYEYPVDFNINSFNK